MLWLCLAGYLVSLLGAGASRTLQWKANCLILAVLFSIIGLLVKQS